MYFVGNEYSHDIYFSIGWQENPVDFDSVFNESRLTYCWGSCDIIPMFSSKAVKGNVIGKCYKEDMINFADKDGSRVDEWVYGEVEEFFKTAWNNSTLQSKLKSDKLVFFLHLLGKLIRVNKGYINCYRRNICQSYASFSCICDKLKQTCKSFKPCMLQAL